jgi:two-component system, NarL family, response regulator LiaR
MRVLIACTDADVEAAFLDSLERAEISALTAPPDAAAVLELARRHGPDIVLLDDDLPGLGGIARLERLTAEIPDSRVVIITGRYEEGRGISALLAGATGYLSRDLAPEALPRVVLAVIRDEAAIPRSLTTALIELVRSEVRMRPVKSVLTPREWEVLDLLTTGATTEHIANELVVSLETVQSHIKHILSKLGVHSRAEAIARADELRRNNPQSFAT